MWNKFKTIAPLIAVIFLVTSSAASHLAWGQSYVVHTYTEAEGMGSATVHGVVQDRLGRMWVATRAGISMYDGVEWENYTVEDGLPTLSFGRIAIDQNDRIWALGYENKVRLAYAFLKEDFSRGRLRWHEVPPPPGDMNVGSTDSLSLMENGGANAIGSEPVIAVGTRRLGVFIRKQGKWFHIDKQAGLLHNHTNGIIRVGAYFYVATASGISTIDKNLQVDNSLKDSLQLPFEMVQGIGLEEAGRFESGGHNLNRVWIYNRNWLAGFDIQADGSPGKTTSIPVEARLSDDNRPVVVLPDYRSGVYISDIIGITYYNTRTGSWQYIRSINGLISEGGYGMAVDFEKNIWIGCGRGLSKIASRRLSTYKMMNGMLEDEVTAIQHYAPGSVLLGHNSGITFMEDKSFQTVPFAGLGEGLLGVVRVLDIHMDRHENIWLALSKGGIIKVDRAKKIHRYMYSRPEMSNLSLWIDKRENIWIGTMRGLYRAPPAKGKPTFSQITGFPGTSVRRIFGDGEGVWAAAMISEGLNLYDRANGVWRNYTVPGNSIANRVYSVLRYHGDAILVGTLDGLYIFENNKLSRFSRGGLKLDRPVYFIFRDRQNRLWFGTNHGVTRWDGTKVRHYTTSEGLACHETNRDAIGQDSRGRVWIGTNCGVSIYDQAFDNTESFNPKPKIYLTHLAVQGTGRRIPLNDNKPVRLHYDEDTFEIHFRGISFEDEQRIRFKSRLRGLEKEWTQESFPYRQFLRYTNLSPGSYRFQIKVRNVRGLWSDVASSPGIVVGRPFYNQWWFYLLVLSGVVGLLIVVTRYISERRHADMLEQEVARRTRQLALTQQRLAQAQKLEAIGTLAGGIAHEFNNVLGIITGYTEMLQEDLEEDSVAHKNAGQVLTAAARATEMVKKVLAFSRHEERPLEPISLTPVTLESLDLLMGSLPSNILLKRHFNAARDTVLADAGQWNKVIMNLVENAVHAMKESGGLLEVSLDTVRLGENGTEEQLQLEAGEYIRLTVKDTGHGIPRVVLKRIFEPYFTTRETGQGAGMGLAVIHGIVKDHGGDISIASQPGEGTTVRVYLPLYKENGS